VGLGGDRVTRNGSVKVRQLLAQGKDIVKKDLYGTCRIESNTSSIKGKQFDRGHPETKF